MLAWKTRDAVCNAHAKNNVVKNGFNNVIFISRSCRVSALTGIPECGIHGAQPS